MKMIDEYDFDYSSYGFREKIVNNDILLSSLDVKENNRYFDMGRYRIISCPNLFLCGKRKLNSIKQYFIKILCELFNSFNIDKMDTILVVGLGNKNIEADSLGENVCSRVLSTRIFDSKIVSSSICSICPNVQTKTGIETYDIVSGLVKEIKPKLVILVDSLITKNIKRIGHSFQLSTCGIIPGGGIKNGKKISKETINVNCLTIGVPFMIDLKDVSKTINKSIIVSPKDIQKMIEVCSKIIADCINIFFNEDLKKEEIYELLT